ncbi:MAG: type II toxin-antitoxin system RelE/ParE family toxin [Desulfobacteraceae bacterium]|nr:type II toxin-antitoxin system RelE/ParE family toxin [Desulfobacteraceae bacterium]
MLNAAVSLKSLQIPPGSRLEQLKGNRKGQHSIRINNKWRICFYYSLNFFRLTDVITRRKPR